MICYRFQNVGWTPTFSSPRRWAGHPTRPLPPRRLPRSICDSWLNDHRPTSLTTVGSTQVPLSTCVLACTNWPNFVTKQWQNIYYRWVVSVEKTKKTVVNPAPAGNNMKSHLAFKGHSESPNDRDGLTHLAKKMLTQMSDHVKTL